MNLIKVLSKVDPWTADNIHKAVDKYARNQVYTYLALVIQDKFEDYLPIPSSLEVIGKKETIRRLK